MELERLDLRREKDGGARGRRGEVPKNVAREAQENPCVMSPRWQGTVPGARRGFGES